LPGLVGRQHFYADKDGSAGQTSPAKKTALIIVGGGQTDLKAGRTDAQLDDVLRKEFEKYVKGYTVTLKHVSSAKAMTDLIAGSSWDAVIYFGHGVLGNEGMLNPAGDYGYLKPEDLIASLQRAKPGKVYILGCESARTGLARRVSKAVSGASVFGMVDDLDVTWKTTKTDQGVDNSLSINAEPSEYVNGRYVVNGQTPARRPHEAGDPVDPTGGPGGPFDDSVPNN
jgi:hypothetical protein